VVAVGFRQLLDPSMPSWSTHVVQVMSGQTYLPKESSQLVLASKQDVQLEEVEDPAREYGRSATHLMQVVTLPVALLYVPGGHGEPLRLVLPRGQYRPAVATHAPEHAESTKALPIPCCPGGHQLQNPDPGAAKVPTGHIMDAALPKMEPAGHAYPPGHCPVQVLVFRLVVNP
jgi:hypothetical protein